MALKSMQCFSIESDMRQATTVIRRSRASFSWPMNVVCQQRERKVAAES